MQNEKSDPGVNVSEEAKKFPLDIIYDGDCPVCARYCLYADIREVYSVRLMNARTEPELVAHLQRDFGVDLNEGMVVRRGDTVLHGAEAFAFLENVRKKRQTLRYFVAKRLAIPSVAGVIYPVLRLGRNILLWGLGIKRI